MEQCLYDSSCVVKEYISKRSPQNWKHQIVQTAFVRGHFKIQVQPDPGLVKSCVWYLNVMSCSVSATLLRDGTSFTQPKYEFSDEFRQMCIHKLYILQLLSVFFLHLLWLHSKGLTVAVLSLHSSSSRSSIPLLSSSICARKIDWYFGGGIETQMLYTYLLLKSQYTWVSVSILLFKLWAQKTQLSSELAAFPLQAIQRLH